MNHPKSSADSGKYVARIDRRANIDIELLARALLSLSRERDDMNSALPPRDEHKEAS